MGGGNVAGGKESSPSGPTSASAGPRKLTARRIGGNMSQSHRRRGRKRTLEEPPPPCTPPSRDLTLSLPAVVAVAAVAGNVDPTAEIYSLDLLQYLRERELLTPGGHFRNRSPQLEKRRHLVDWTCLVAEKLGLVNRVTVHLGVRILDFFMEGHDIEELQLYLVCLASLILAAKMEEKDSQVPKIPQVSQFLGKKCEVQASDFQRLEIMILSYLDWKLNWPTAAHFVDLLFPFAIAQSDFLEDRSIGDNFEAVTAKFRQFVNYFLDISLQDDAFLTMRPSIVASSILYCSRVAIDLSPEWTVFLKDATGGHSPGCTHEVAYCSSRLLTVYDASTAQITPPRSGKQYYAENSSPPCRSNSLSPDEGYGGYSFNESDVTLS